MKSGLIALLAAMCAWAVDPVPLDVKEGQWHTVITTTGRGGTKSQSGTNCITKEKLADLLSTTDQYTTCKRTLVSSSPTRMEMKLDCQAPNGKQSGTTVVEAPDKETLKLHSKMGGAAAGEEMSMSVDWISNWVGPTCAPPKAKKKK